VDEVVGDLDVFRRADEAVGVGDVAFVEVQADRLEPVGFRAVANQAADGRLRLRQRDGQPGADKPGGSGDEGTCGDLLKVALAAGLQD
jgi:hypothetical protein